MAGQRDRRSRGRHGRPAAPPNREGLDRPISSPSSSNSSRDYETELGLIDIERLFGAEAAEDEASDRLLEYFLKTEIWHSVTDLRRNLRVLVGKKGTGKSAIFRIAAQEDEEAGRLSVIVQPDDFTDIALDETDHLALVRAWSAGLTRVILEKALRSLGTPDQPASEARLLSAAGRVLDLIARALGPRVKGFSVDPARKDLAEAFLKNRELTVYFDDLDRGWEGSTRDIRRLAAMFDAIRDLLRDNTTLRCRIGLRTDVYTLLRTDPASDKYEVSVVHHSWSNHEVFVLLIKRIESYFGRDADYDRLLRRRQSDLARFLDPILEPTFRGAGRWHNAPMYSVILSFARRRPRDLVKLLTFAAREAQRQHHSRISTDDLQRVFSQFSQGRLQDTVNEFRTELPQLESVLLAMKPNRAERTTTEAYVMPTDRLVRKLREVITGTAARFTDGRRTDPMSLLAFLYKIDFLQARRDEGDNIQRMYFDENHLVTPDQLDVGFDWEIHLAFRWVLQPDRPEDIYRFTEPSAAG